MPHPFSSPPAMRMAHAEFPLQKEASSCPARVGRCGPAKLLASLLHFMDTFPIRKAHRAMAWLAAQFSPRLWTRARSVFVLSTGRTGTETLARLLALFPHVDAYHEPSPQLLRERQQAFLEVYATPDKYLAILRAARRAALTNSLLRGKVYAETSARLTFLAPAIAQAMPNARFIFLHRHPAEVVRSGMRRNWYNGHPADMYRIFPPPGTLEATRWPEWSQFQKISWYWKAYNRFALDFLRLHGRDRVFVLPFGAIRSVDVRVFGSLFRFLGLPQLPDDAVASVLGTRFNEQLSGEFPHYSEWSREQRIMLAEICEPEMSELGYTM